jgi:hypothetical protein
VDLAELAELEGAGEGVRRAARELGAALAGPADVTVLTTRPRSMFLVDALLAAWLAPQVAYLKSGGNAADLAASLRAFGFTRFAGDWVAGFGLSAMAGLVKHRRPDLNDVEAAVSRLPTSGATDGERDPRLIDAMVLSLGAFAARMTRMGAVRHPAILDVAAREVIDFPLQHTSLCRYLSLARAGRLLDASGGIRRLITEDDIFALKEFVANGSEYYRGHQQP